MNAMVHAADDDLVNRLSDFSSSWLKDDSDDVLSLKPNQRKYKNRLKAVKKERPIANRNISSIVSRIRDEGAAFSSKVNESAGSVSTSTPQEKIKMDKGPGKDSDKGIVEDVMAFDESCDNDTVTLSSEPKKLSGDSVRKTQGKQKYFSKPSFSAVCDQVVELDEGMKKNKVDQVRNEKSNRKWWSFIAGFGLITILVFGYMSYQFKLQSDEMRQALYLYQQAMPKDELDPSKQIKEKKVAVMSKKQAAIKPAMSVPPVIAIDKKMGEKKDINKKSDIKAGKLDINEPKVTKKLVVKEQKVAKENVAEKLLPKTVSSVKRYVAIDKPIMFTVNLASFTEKSKAYSQLAVFKSLGVHPIIEQAAVGSKMVYRLCVEGFSSREEAGWFISRLNKKHAVNAWVRKS